MHAQSGSILLRTHSVLRCPSKIPYKATMRAKTEPASTPETVRTLLVSMELAELPDADVLEALPEPVDKAWIPKVVPVTTEARPSVVMVVVTVAGSGVAVVLEQPDQKPVQEEYGPQPAVQVVQEAVPEQAMPLAFVPQGPPHGPLPPGPLPPGPPQECPPQLLPQLLPGPQPDGAEPIAVDTWLAQAAHEALSQLPPGPQFPVAVGHSEPPDVAENVACCEFVTVSPALAQS